MKDLVFALAVLASISVFLLWIFSLVWPSASVFKFLGEKIKGRKKLSATLLPASVILFIIAGFFASTPIAKLDDVSLKSNQEVMVDTYTITGKASGIHANLRINNEEVELVEGEFSKTVNLKPGDNNLEVLLMDNSDKGNSVEVYKQSNNIYFDYEGMLYAKEQRLDEKLARELDAKVSKIPEYEIVRKLDIEKGISGVIYADGESEDYLMANVVKDARSKNEQYSNLTFLVFNKADKEAVEAVFEDSNPAKLLPYVRANYEKKDTHEELFWFPEGAEGKKMALEI